MGKSLEGKELGGGIYQRQDGRYSARFTNRAGRRIERYFDKASDAKNWIEDARYEERHGDVFASSDMTVRAWAEYWLENIIHMNRKYNTWKSYKGRYDHRIDPVIGRMLLQEVKPLHCQEVLNRAQRKGDTSGSVGKIKSILYMIFESAMDNGFISTNPVTKNVKYEKVDPEEKRALTRDEERRFDLASADCSHHDEFMFVLETGIRCGELSGLKWSDISWEDRSIRISETMFFNNDTKVFETNSPKTRASKRRIPLTDKAYDILADRRSRRKDRIESIRYHNYVFLNDNGLPTDNRTYDKCLKLITHKMGIDGFTMHCLRHTFATKCVEAGMNPKVLQRILGHKSIATTMNLYVHTFDEEVDAEMQKIGEITGKVSCVTGVKQLA